MIEELKKEAEEKAKKRTKGFKCQENCEMSYVMGAIDFAEPREKRIAKLEAQIEELKKQLNIRSCQNCKHNNKSCPSDGSCKNYSKWEGFENPQLTKAKEFLEWALHVDVEHTDSAEFEKKWDEAEQFLKEEDPTR